MYDKIYIVTMKQSRQQDYKILYIWKALKFIFIVTYTWISLSDIFYILIYLAETVFLNDELKYFSRYLFHLFQA